MKSLKEMKEGKREPLPVVLQYLHVLHGSLLLPCLLVLLLGLAAAGCARDPEPERPPVVLVSVDTLRADHLGCYGYERPTSPGLDRFARQAVVFREAFASAPVTAPSHMSILTGLSPAVHGVINFRQEEGENRARARSLSPRIPTLPEFLREHGYLTVALTAGGNISEKMGFGRGFDHFSTEFEQWVDEEGRYRTGIEDLGKTRETIRGWIRRSRDEKKPLFLFLHHNVCHDPYLSGPAEYRLRFLTDPVEGLPTGAGGFGEAEGFGDVRGSFFRPLDPDNPDHVRHYVDLYDGGVLFSDVIFSLILETLREEGIGEKSLVIFLSDHGEEFFEHKDKLHWKLFRETIRVPLVIRFPHNRWAGKSIEVPVRLVDIFPTVAAVAGLDDSLPRVQGESLLPLLTGAGYYRPDPVSFSGNGRAVRLSRDGHVYFNQAIDETRERLFAGDDLGENANLAESDPELLDRMQVEARREMARQEAWRKELLGNEVPREIEADENRMEQLRALGYVK